MPTDTETAVAKPWEEFQNPKPWEDFQSQPESKPWEHFQSESSPVFPGGSLGGVQAGESIPTALPKSPELPAIPEGTIPEFSIPTPEPPKEEIGPQSVWDAIRTSPTYSKVFGRETALGQEAGLAQILTAAPLPFALEGKAGKALMAYFVGSYLKDRPEAWDRLYNEFKAGDPAAPKELLGEFLQAGMAGMMTKGLVEGHPVPEATVAEIKTATAGAPLTGEALKTTLTEFQSQVKPSISGTGVEPPVPEGFTRLYRGETSPRPPAFSEAGKIDRETFEPEKFKGQWFTGDRSVAERYLKASHDPNGTLKYVDVPTDQLESFRASNTPEAKKHSLSPSTEFLVPESVPRSNMAGPGSPSITQGPDVAPTAPILTRMTDSVRGLPAFLKGLAGHTMPKTTAADRVTGEAGAEYLSSQIAAAPLAHTFAISALEGTNVDPVKFGAALTEDNLRSVRVAFEEKSADLEAKGDADGAAAATASAENVHSLIGGKKSPFKTEQEYQDFLADPDTQKAITRHIDQWEKVIEPQFKAAQNIDPDVQLPTRGLQTGARINLKAIREGEQGANPVRGYGPNLTNTFKKKSIFGREAKGTGQEYETNYGEIIHNTFSRQLEIANKNLFDQALVKSKNAVIAPPGTEVNIGGEGTTAFPLQRRMVVTNKDGTTQTFSKNENIYVRNSLAREYEYASNVTKKPGVAILTPAMNFLNKAALAGLTDATVHVSNQMTALFNRPVSGKLLTDSLLSATGRADIPVTLTKFVIKAMQNNHVQIAELSKIGAMRESLPSNETNPLGKVTSLPGKALKFTDKVTRLLLDDTFKSLAKEGLVEDTPTNRREYVNQIGQYNRRAQGLLTRAFRDIGFGPFVTAGRTFNALGVKMATLSPGAKASSNLAAAALRANVLSKWVGAATLIGTVNYLITGKMMGRPGTPIGSVDSGKDDESGKPLTIPALDIIGVGRGLRVTGIRGAAQAKYLGLPNQVAADAAARDIINSATSPFAGPGIRFAKIAATGEPTAINVGRVAPVVPPGKNQLAQNVESAAIEANPLIKSIHQKAVEGKSWREALAGQLPRFTLTSGKPPEMVENYPEIVHKAQLNAYLDDVVGRARKMPEARRDEYLDKVMENMDPEDIKHAKMVFKFRKVRK